MSVSNNELEPEREREPEPSPSPSGSQSQSQSVRKSRRLSWAALVQLEAGEPQRLVQITMVPHGERCCIGAPLAPG